MTGFRPVDAPPRPAREAYLEALPEPQEWFLEEMVAGGEAWVWEDGSYAVVRGATLVEFAPAGPVTPGQGAALLHAFVAERGLTVGLVKSFDLVAMRAFEALGWRAHVGGLLFRRRVARACPEIEGAQVRPAQAGDGARLWAINEDFFDSPQEIDGLIRSGALWALAMAGELVGCGVAQRVPGPGSAVDIGMMVAPARRRHGLGTFVICHLADEMAGQGLRPVCGCGAGNVASRATLERAGFVTEHHLVRFEG
ncbi:GNAT family N-acetyltransferase [Roseobacteraceae bacterium S113]